MPREPYTILDKSYEFPDDFNFLKVAYPQFKTRSVWFNEECHRAASAQEIAQELDIDYAASGWQFFDANIIEKLKKSTAMRPLAEGEVFFSGEDWKHPQWSQMRGGRLQLWFTPTVDGTVSQAWKDVICGVDVATGKGGEMSSNSVASFARRTTGEMVAQFVTNQMSPTEYCFYVLALCKWFNEAFLIWEENGPGGEFTKRTRLEGYRNIFYREEETNITRKKTSKVGWHSNKDSKRILLSDYANALKNGSFINRSLESLTELSEYIMEPNGSIEHTRSKNTVDPTATGENHGDRVIADSLAYRGIMDVSRANVKPELPAPPIGSFGARRLLFRQDKKAVSLY